MPANNFAKQIQLETIISIPEIKCKSTQNVPLLLLSYVFLKIKLIIKVEEMQFNNIDEYFECILYLILIFK